MKNYSAGEITGPLQSREAVPIMRAAELVAPALPPTPAAYGTATTEGRA